MDVLRKKSKYATEEPFVFIKFDVDEAQNDDQCLNLAKIIELKTSGNQQFKLGRYGDAISSYTKAIALFKGCTANARDLANCYQNRAAAYEKQGNYAKCIEDAGKAIAASGVYAKAYYRRAKGYAAQRRYYAAMQDVMQACILEQFRNDAFNKMAAEVASFFENTPDVNHGLRSYDELKCAERECDHCKRESVIALKASTILNPVIVPVDKSAPNTGYNRAIRAIAEGNVKDALNGCKEVISSGNTEDINYCRAVILQVHLRLSTSSQGDLVYADLQMLNKILGDKRYPDEMREPLMLSRARIYARLNMLHQAEEDLLDVEKSNPKNPHIYIVRAGLLNGFDYSDPLKMAALKQLCQLMPRLYFAQYRRIYAKFHKSKELSKLLEGLTWLMEQFPEHIESGSTLVRLMTEFGFMDQAKELFDKLVLQFPDDKHGVLDTNRGLLKPLDPSSVRYFKKSIEKDTMDTKAHRALFNYYTKASFEYAKAFEVINRALMMCNEKGDLLDMFNERHALLQQVIKQDFWRKL